MEPAVLQSVGESNYVYCVTDTGRKCYQCATKGIETIPELGREVLGSLVWNVSFLVKEYICKFGYEDKTAAFVTILEVWQIFTLN